MVGAAAGVPSSDDGRTTLAVDVGGTFTDVVLRSPAGRIFTEKVLSTPRDYADGIVHGVNAVLQASQTDPEAINVVLHATTVATNAVIERTGARVGLITTDGCRDVLELRRVRFPDMYNLFWEKPVPLVPRCRRKEISERTLADGTIALPIDEGAAEALVDELVNLHQVNAIAIALLNSYKNPENERRIYALIQDNHPNLPVTASSDVLPTIREYERTSTAVTNAYLAPVASRYLSALETRLQALGIVAPIYVMQSSGGMTTSRGAATRPVEIVESGPAAGILGAAEIARRRGDRIAAAFDMGGTTAKAALIENGEPFFSREFEIGAPVSVASRILKGGGYLLGTPTVDLAEIGAGGGSIVWIDPAGALLIGPRSAGADPGPICYGRGGTEPTVTDANVVVGYIPRDFLGSQVIRLKRAEAVAAFESLGAQLGMSWEQCAMGAIRVANATMASTIRSVYAEHGVDPRSSTLIAFGGSGGLHAASIAAELGIPEVVIPPYAGLFGSSGLDSVPLERRFPRTLYRTVSKSGLSELKREIEVAGNEALDALRGEKWPETELSVRLLIDMRYAGQGHTIPVRVPSMTDLRNASDDDLRAWFNAAHERAYGYREAASPVQVETMTAVVSIRDGMRLRAAAADGAPRRADDPNGALKRTTLACFGGGTWAETAVMMRADVAAGNTLSGPCIVESEDTSVLVPPSATFVVENDGTLLLWPLSSEHVPASLDAAKTRAE